MEKSKASFKVQVQYCASWGSGNYGMFVIVQKAVKAEYPEVECEGVGVGGRTGCLEVTVIKSNGDSKKIHSKLGGDGAVSSSNISKIMEKLKEYISK